ncbi:hypothetical protein VNI00_000030 [Paramarasmius palmivorus]|uniref:CNH domain-containing protein n=1 Tax=Paramarasmius palmivorus TaxID=297713 RepID=A0AAW0EEM5_9AGAR
MNVSIVCPEFGLYVDLHGRPIQDKIEWESPAEQVTFHSRYILLFNTQCTEIRELETGKMVQIIEGNNVQCTWDGLGVVDEAAPQTGIHVTVNTVDEEKTRYEVLELALLADL